MTIQAEYLKRLGVDLWLPRVPLVGAPRSPDWVYQFTHPAQEAIDSQATAEKVGRPQAASAVALDAGHSLDEIHAEQRSIAHISEALAESTDSPIKGAAKEPGSAHRVAPQLVPRFRFALVRTPRFLIIDELPTQGPQLLSDSYKKLLVGIVAALGEEPEQMSLPVLLQWPHLAGSKLNQGADEAFKYVQLTLESMQKRGRAEHLILFGSGLSRWVVGESQAEVASGELNLHPTQNTSYLVSSTLSQALRLPEIKRQIWADLQPVAPN